MGTIKLENIATETTRQGVLSVSESMENLNKNIKDQGKYIKALESQLKSLQRAIEDVNKTGTDQGKSLLQRFRSKADEGVEDYLSAGAARVIGRWGKALGSLGKRLNVFLAIGYTAVTSRIDKYKEEREMAIGKALETSEIESDGRAEMVKSGYELEQYIKRVGEFRGTKEQEARLIGELNDRYGDTIGTYSNLSDWYVTLISYGKQYVNMLFLQAKIQSLIKKATEADAKGNEKKALLQAGPGFMDYVENIPNFGAWIRDEGLKNYTRSQFFIATKNAYDKDFEEREKYLTEASAFQDQLNAIEDNLHTRKEKNKPKFVSAIPNAQAEMEEEKKNYEKLRDLRWQNEQDEIDGLKAGSEKQIRQIKLNYAKKEDAIRQQEQQWRNSQKGELTADQQHEITKAYKIAWTNVENSVNGVKNDEMEKNKKKLDALLEEFKGYDQKRRSIQEKYNADMLIYNEELDRLRKEGGDASAVEDSVKARTEGYKKDILALETQILQTSDFYTKLFADVSEKGHKIIRNFYGEAQSVIDNAKVGEKFVELEIDTKDENGDFIKKKVNITIEEFQKMKKQVKTIQTQLEKDNPFRSFQTAYSDLMKTIKNDGDVSGALKTLNTKGKELTATIKGWGDSLGAVFGNRLTQSVGEMVQFADGMMDMGAGIAQIYSGDIVGGITNTLKGVSAIFSMFTSWKEKMEEMRRKWYLADIETSRTIRDRNTELAISRDTIQDIVKEQELLNWLIEKGFSKPASLSVWESHKAALAEYQVNLKDEMGKYDGLWKKLQGSNAKWTEADSLSSKTTTISLRTKTAEEIEAYYNQNKLSAAARDYYDAWVKSGKSIQELKKHIEETGAALQEMVMGVSFDGFLSNVKSALLEAKGDVGSFATFTKKAISEALINSFMYQDLAKVIEPLYNELSKSMVDGTADRTYLENWKNQFENAMSAANGRLNVIAEATGIDLYSTSDSSQSGQAGTFTTMSQEQGTKLEGLFTSLQDHASSIDFTMLDISRTMYAASDKLSVIAHNTSYCAHLEQMAGDIAELKRDGIKMK